MAVKIYEALQVGPLQCNCYVVGDDVTKEAVVIDPGGDADIIIDAIARHGLKVVAIVATHAHFDHVTAAQQIRAATGAPFCIHEDDIPLLGWMSESMQMFLGIKGPPPPEVDRRLDEGDSVAFGTSSMDVLHTPGHSEGSISLIVKDEMIFAGDTLFAMSIGRTDLPGGDYDAEISSIKQKLFPLGDLLVYPGHGPSTNIDREKLFNPFLGSGR